MLAETDPLILLVDDDPNDEELARIALESTDIPHRLVIKRDGAEAISWVLENEASLTSATRLKLILLDLKLPKINGLEVLQKLKTNLTTKSIPIVIFTSSSELGDLTQSYALGANAYIRKPVHFGEYRQTIEDVGRFWILRNQAQPFTTGLQK